MKDLATIGTILFWLVIAFVMIYKLYAKSLMVEIRHHENTMVWLLEKAFVACGSIDSELRKALVTHSMFQSHSSFILVTSLMKRNLQHGKHNSL